MNSNNTQAKLLLHARPFRQRVFPKMSIFPNEVDTNNFELLNSEIHRRLVKRKKWSRLLPDDKIFLIKIMTAYPDKHNYIKNVYKLSQSTFYRLKLMMANNFESYQALETLHYKELLLDNSIRTTLKSIIRPPQFSLTMKKISEQFEKATGLNLPKSKLAKYLKSKLRYSFIKGNHRPPKIMTQNHLLAKGCFSARVLRYLLQGIPIADCDESSFDRSVRNNYSWLLSGTGGSIIGEVVGGKSNLILSIFPDGAWIAMIKDETVDSVAFSFYLTVLTKVLKGTERGELSKFWLLLDNATSHHSTFSTSIVQSLGLSAVYLPAYCPELAPVELCFKAVKSIIRSRYIHDKIDFSNEIGKNVIISTLSNISREYFSEWWRKAVVQLKGWVRSTLALEEEIEV